MQRRKFSGKYLKSGYHAVRGKRHNAPGDKHTYKCRQKCFPEAHLDRRGDQRAGPRSRYRQRYRNEKEKSPTAVFAYLVAF